MSMGGADVNGDRKVEAQGVEAGVTGGMVDDGTGAGQGECAGRDGGGGGEDGGGSTAEGMVLL
ncbi:hypothetical protein H4W33_009867 [Kibdelosporangium phytohabitans]|nr:hypothetical protein [Kibdelosporangium phytohabitans]MBE1470793.1 hypothetical protein [Kibdelosporangium phytohabitans]